MDLLLTDEQTMLVDSAARLCRTDGGWMRARARFRDGRDLDEAAWAAAAQAGWLGLLVPEPQGGSGLGAFELALVMREAGRHAFGAPVAGPAVAAAALAQAGCDVAAEIAGKRLTVPALSGAGTPFQADGALPLVTHEGGVAFLNGRHRSVVAVEAASTFVVTAVEAQQRPIVCRAEATAEGLTRRRPGSLGGADDGEVAFAKTPVEVVATGEEAAAIAAAAKSRMIVATSAEMLGLGMAAHDVATDYVKTRHQFARPIGSFQALQHRLVDGFVGLELLTALVFRTAADLDAGRAHPAMLPALKAKAGTAMLAVIRTALQVHGAMGYTDEHDLSLFFKRAIALDVFMGNDAYQYAQFQERSAS